MTTIKDIAQKADLAVSTVSYALNDSSKISDKTKKKVIELAKELNYQPNGTARNLKKQKTETIGLFLNDLGGPYYSELIKGVQEVTSSNEYDLVACDAAGGVDSTAYTFLKEKRVDGAIILAPSISDELIIQVAKNQLPTVVLDRELESEHICNVLIDNIKGAYKAVSHLTKLGIEKIAYLSGATDSYDNKNRFKGYKKALLDKGISYQPDWFIEGCFTEESGYKAIKELLVNKKSANLPEAIFAANDEMAIGAIQALQEGNIKVPDDIAVVGFDDINLASYIRPSLTTISHPKYQLGKLATQMVFEGLEENFAGKSITISTDLVVRESCGG
ncbi:LacI family DNA-binding transcriptional regulator [Halobacteroides halobius]|nr:LacI family DNA-binding transcriptional regulator [Halobacteroides halobius]